MPASLPENVSQADTSQQSLCDYVLHLADNSLIMGHRLSEWAGHGPMLEQDIAVSNIALDLVGQARNFYQYAAEIKNTGRSQSGSNGSPATEDSLAYLRGINEFKNIVLVELENGDWAKTVLKLFFFSSFQCLLYGRLVNSRDKQLSAIAEKSLKEVVYHVRWSSGWVIRLGDGTPESHSRLLAALNQLWQYTGEMFIASGYENVCSSNNTGVAVNTLRDEWKAKINDVFSEATIPLPPENSAPALAGKEGVHTAELQKVLSEMQYLQRTLPGCDW